MPCERTGPPRDTLYQSRNCVSPNGVFPRIIVGVAAIEIWEYVTRGMPQSVAQPLSGFFVTLMTGQVFILAAIGIGYTLVKSSEELTPKLPDAAPETETESPNQTAQPPQS